MDCPEFESRWQALLSESLDDVTRSGMEQHAKLCPACGARWQEHERMLLTIRSVLEGQKSTSGLAERVADKAFQERFGATMKSQSSPLGGMKSNSLAPLLLAFMVGILIGYLLGERNPQSNIAQQMLLGRSLFGSGGRNDLHELLMLSELVGASGVRGAGWTRVLPSTSTAVQILFWIFVIHWLTRTNVWDVLFPTKKPPGIQFARLVGIVAVLLGGTRCAISLYVAFQALTAAGYNPNELDWLPSALMFVDHLWNIALWLTLIVVFFTGWNYFAQQFARQWAETVK